MVGLLPMLAVCRGVIVFTPLFVSNLKAWYKADAITANDGDGLSSWADSSGNGNTLAVIDSSKKPVYKTNIVNGMPVTRYNGVSATGFAIDWVDISQPTTLFAVGNQTNKTTSGRMIDAFTGNRELLGLKDTSGFFDMYGGAASVNDSTDHSGGFHVLCARMNGASSFGYVDGTQVVSSNPGSQGIGQLFIGTDGGTATLTGDIAEIVIYTKDLSTTERDNVTNYLKSKYGIS